MNFDPISIVVSMIVSTIGFGLFKFGRGQHRFPHTAVGLLIMLYPYGITSVAWMLGLLPVFFGLLWVAIRMGL